MQVHECVAPAEKAERNARGAAFLAKVGMTLDELVAAGTLDFVFDSRGLTDADVASLFVRVRGALPRPRERRDGKHRGKLSNPLIPTQALRLTCIMRNSSDFVRSHILTQSQILDLSNNNIAAMTGCAPWRTRLLQGDHGKL